MDTTHFPWLTISILFPVLASLLIPVIPDKDGRTVRWYALIIGLIDFVILVYAFYTGYDFNNSNLQLVESYTWLPQLDLKWSVAADGLSMPLILLTGFITTLAILAAWPVTLKPKLFYFLMLAMYGGQIAVFAVQDMLLFFLVWELELIPGLFTAIDLGWLQTVICCHQIHPLHCHRVFIYFSRRFSHGFLWG